MGTAHNIKKKRKNTFDPIITYPIHKHNEPIYQCEIEHVIAFIDAEITVLEFYNKLTKDGTNYLCDINQPAKNNRWTLLHFACDARNFKIVEALCCAGANINALAEGKYTPLNLALKNNDLKIARYLIERGAFALTGIYSYLKLDAQGNQEIIALQRYLQEKGIKNYSYPFTTEYDYRDLIDLICNNNITDIKVILENSNIHLTSQNINHPSIMHQAIYNDSLPIVQLLVQHGALIIEDDWGVSSIELAYRHNFHDIACFLEETQKKRLACLKKYADRPAKYSLLLWGFFHEENSSLCALGGNSDVARRIMRDMVEIENRCLVGFESNC